MFVGCNTDSHNLMSTHKMEMVHRLEIGYLFITIRLSRNVLFSIKKRINIFCITHN